jgi:pilus assembly protein Flp/PilA
MEMKVREQSKQVVKFVADKNAVTALEYGIIASILGLVLVGIFTSFGSTLTTLFSNVSTSI